MPLQQDGSALPPQSARAQRCALRTSRPCTARHCQGYANGPGPGPCLLYAGSSLTSCGLKSCWPDSAPQLLINPRPHGPEARAKAQGREHSAARLQTYQHRRQQWPRPAHVPARLRQSSSFALFEHSTWLSIASFWCCRQLPGAAFAQLCCHAGPC